MGRPHSDDESPRASIREPVERGVDQIKLYAHMDIDDMSNIAMVIRAGERLDFETLRGTMSELSEVTPSDPVTNDLLDFVRDIEAEDPGFYPRPASVRFFAEEQKAKSQGFRTWRCFLALLPINETTA